MDYMTAMRHLLGLVDYERVSSSNRQRIRYDLRRMEALLLRLGSPHLGIPTVHIAGTKGKGSTAAMCASVLSEQGYHTGLYTSPHLHTFRERISLDGKPASEEVFAALVEEVWPAIRSVSEGENFGEVTMFEALTAMASCHFRRWADVQVLEVGLGGRLDTTNLACPTVCAITSLSLDHTSVLGNTLESIAREKAGIIKSGTPVVTAPQPPEAMAVIESVARECGAELVKVGEDVTWCGGGAELDGQEVRVKGRLGSHRLRIPLLGDFQLENAATALATLEVLKERGLPISDTALERGFNRVSWPCRMEVLGLAPLVVCDGAHNPYSVARLRGSLPMYFGDRGVVLVLGISQDKNLEGMVEELAQISRHVIVTRSRHPRAAPAETVADIFRARGVTVAQVEGVDRAMVRALEEAGEGDMVLATGSLFVAAEAREFIKGIEPELYPELHGDPYPVSR